jgi:hypothetical protein
MQVFLEYNEYISHYKSVIMILKKYFRLKIWRKNVVVFLPRLLLVCAKKFIGLRKTPIF